MPTVGLEPDQVEELVERIAQRVVELAEEQRRIRAIAEYVLRGLRGRSLQELVAGGVVTPEASPEEAGSALAKADGEGNDHGRGEAEPG
jgi:ribosomal protein L12E/L44/L45/RPP1/RPP2